MLCNAWQQAICPSSPAAIHVPFALTHTFRTFASVWHACKDREIGVFMVQA